MNDEYYTPSYAIEPIAELCRLRDVTTAWHPFDTGLSKYPQVFGSYGIGSVCTHIATGQNFFDTEPPGNADAIVSNPPFSILYRVIDRCFDIGLPFALLVPSTFNNAKTFDILHRRSSDIGMLFMGPRVEYYNLNTGKGWRPPFESLYLTNGLGGGISFARVDRGRFDAVDIGASISDSGSLFDI